MKTLLKTVLALSALIAALTISPAQAGWFTQDPEDVCERALETKQMKSVISTLTDQLKAYSRSAVQNVLSRITGRGNARTNRAAYQDGESISVHIEPFLKAFESLAGHVIKIYYESNTSGGLIRSAIPNINLRVPENVLELVKTQFVVIRDTFSGDQIYVLPFFEKVDAEGKVILDPTTGQPERVAIYINPHNPDPAQGGVAVFSDIEKFEIVGKSDFERADRKALIAVLERKMHWGLLDNLRPGVMTERWVAKGHTYQVIVSADGGIQANTFINLIRATIDNTVRGKNFDLNEVYWNRLVPFVDSHGRPLNLTTAIQHGSQGFGNAEEVLNIEDPSTYGQGEELAVINIQEFVAFALREALMTERATYINAIWEIVTDSKRRSVILSAGTLLNETLAAATEDFNILQNNLAYIAQTQSQYLDQWLAYRAQQIDAKLAEGTVSGASKNALFARREQLIALQGKLAATLAEIAKWQINATDLINTSTALATIYFPKITSDLSRGDIAELREDQTYKDFTSAIQRIMKDVGAFETSESQRAGKR